jgi:hypothetical protein
LGEGLQIPLSLQLYARRKFMIGESRKYRRKLKKLISKMKNVDSLKYYYGYIVEKERLKGNTYKV